MTRKALRKKLKKQVAAPLAAPRTVPPWVVAGALVASTALAGARADARPPQPLDPQSSAGSPQVERYVPPALYDPRLALVDEVLRLGARGSRRAVNPSQSSQPQGAVSEDQTVRPFDIPAGPINVVVGTFEAATGVTVAVTTDSIRPITSPGVTGSYTLSQALRQLLAGTNVTFRFTAPSAVTLELRIAAEVVEVTGAAPETTVSIPKYTTPVRDTPQTIQVISQEIFAQQGAHTLTDVLRNVPGISLQAGEGGGASSTSGDMFNMRGFSANNSLFVDGVRDDGLISRDVFNLEQVEVFLGPTGSDVGRGTAAGYVNMDTKTPHLAPAYSASYGYGASDQKRFTVDLGRPMPLGKPGTWLGTAAVRLNGLWQDGGVPGRQTVENKSQAVAPAIGVGLGTPTRLFLGAQFMRQDNVPDYGIPGGAWLETPLAPTTQLALQPVNQSNYFGSVGYDYDKGKQDSYTARLEHDISGNFSWRNQTRYNKTSREAVITSIANPAAFVASTGLVTLSRQGNDRENEIFSNQTSGVGRFITGPLRHAANVSMELTNEEQFAPTIGGVGTRAPVSIYNPNPLDPVIAYNVVRTGASNKGDTATVAFSGFDSVSFGAKWQLTGGLRWEHYNAKYKVVDATGLATTDLTTADGLVSGKAGLLYKWSDQGNVYLSYGSTVTPPGTANFTLSSQENNQNNPNVEPQTSTNLEVGSKWDLLGSRLGLSAALFRTRNRNVIFTVDATAVPPIYNQDDGQRVDGVTLGVTGRLTDRWQLLANVAYLDTALESQNPLTNGNRLTLTPKFSGNLWTTYQTPFRLNIGGGVRFTASVFINAANTIEAPSYRLVDGLVEYAVNTHLMLRMNIDNLTDAVYIRNVNNNGGRYNPGNPRSATVSSTIAF